MLVLFGGRDTSKGEALAVEYGPGGGVCSILEYATPRIITGTRATRVAVELCLAFGRTLRRTLIMKIKILNLVTFLILLIGFTSCETADHQLHTGSEPQGILNGTEVESNEYGIAYAYDWIRQR